MTVKPGPTPFTLRVGRLLQGQRRRCGMTQEQLAEGADVSLKYVGEIERGEANATLGALDQIARVLDWDPWLLFGRPHVPISDKVRRVLIAEARGLLVRSRSLVKWLRALEPSGSKAGAAGADAADGEGKRQRPRRGRPPRLVPDAGIGE